MTKLQNFFYSSNKLECFPSVPLRPILMFQSKDRAYFTDAPLQKWAPCLVMKHKTRMKETNNSLFGGSGSDELKKFFNIEILRMAPIS